MDATLTPEQKEQVVQQKLDKDSALADLSETAVQNFLDKENATGWLSVRGIHRAGNLMHQNVKDLRRRLGRESDEEKANRKVKSAMDEEMKINSPTYPAPIIMQSPPAPERESNGLGKVLAGAAIAAAAMGIPGAGIAGYLISKAMDKPASTTINNVEDKTSIGLKHIEDLFPQGE